MQVLHKREKKAYASGGRCLIFGDLICVSLLHEPVRLADKADFWIAFAFFPSVNPAR
jgi:hypothetical protein